MVSVKIQQKFNKHLTLVNHHSTTTLSIKLYAKKNFNITGRG
jgi:hypothetical protein